MKRYEKSDEVRTANPILLPDMMLVLIGVWRNELKRTHDIVWHDRKRCDGQCPKGRGQPTSEAILKTIKHNNAD